MSAALLPDPNTRHAPPSRFPLDAEVAALFQDLRDVLASMSALIALTRTDDRLALDRPRLIETAPGDCRLADIGYALVHIATDPFTGQDTIWYWQRAESDAAPAVPEPQS